MFRPMHARRGQIPAPERLDAARAWLVEQGEAILSEQVEIARTPAPPFQERERAELIASKLRGMAVEPSYDDIGNLHAWYPSVRDDAETPPVIVAAHVDTVFGPDTPIEIRRDGERWLGPGITDNARGLAVSLAVLRSLAHAGVDPGHPVLFAFTVGEEGAGDLRGVKHLLGPRSPLRSAAAFIAVDGSGLRRIIHHALGSHRFRITVTGAGGHSWTDWGRSNPANAIGQLIHNLSELELPLTPRTTLTVARHGGGSSINAIPAESWVELDLRSEADETLHSTESRIRDVLSACVAAEQARGEGTLSAGFELIGERPAGLLPTDHHLVQAAASATRNLGEEPEHAVASTDANVPLALGIPAIAVGGGGESGDTHTENEWFEDTNGAASALRLLSILASIACF
jgi:tripeptide aminopeptidase